MGFINDHTDTIFTMDAQNPTIRLYAKDSNKVYNSFKEIDIPQSDSIDIFMSSFSNLNNSEYLLSTDNGIIIRFDSKFNPIDIINIFQNSKNFTFDEYAIYNLNNCRVIKNNDSTLFFQIALREPLNDKDFVPFVLYDIKNNTIKQPNIKWKWPELVFKSYQFENRPSYISFNNNSIAILQPHQDSIIVYDWVKNESQFIDIDNAFFKLPKEKLFSNEENLTTDREQYYNYGFIYQMIYSSNDKLFAFYTMPSKDKIAYSNFQFIGLDIQNNNKKYFALKDTQYILRPTSFFTKDKLFLHLYQEPTSLSNETQPATYHIYDMSQLDF